MQSKNTTKGDDWLRKQSIKALFKEYSKKLYDYLFYLLRNKEMAEDTISEVFLQLAEQKDKYRVSKENWQAWLFRVARNRALNTLKRDKKLVDLQTLEQVVEDKSFNLENLHQRLTLEEALNSLPARERDIILLKYRMQFNFAQIAEITNESEVNLRQIASRTIKKLQKICN